MDRTYWDSQREARLNAKPGDMFDFGRCNFGRDQLVLPMVRRTKTRIVCSDGKRTESLMVATGRYVGMHSRVYVLTPNAGYTAK